MVQSPDDLDPPPDTPQTLAMRRLLDLADVLPAAVEDLAALGALVEAGDFQAVYTKAGELLGKLQTARSITEDLIDDTTTSGALTGEVVAICGTLSRPRKKALDLVRQAGGTPADSVDSRTTLLVCGAIPEVDVAGQQIVPSKLSKARTLQKETGLPRILTEAEFCALVGLPPP